MSPPGAGFSGLSFSTLKLEAVLDTVFACVDSPFSYIVTANVDHVIRLDRAKTDREAAAFASAYADAALVLCDSRVLARLSCLSGQQLPVVPGSDLTREMFGDTRISGRRVAVVGGSSTLVSALASCVPGVDFVQHRPPMGVLRDEDAMTDIEAFVAGARADIVIIAIGAPQAEIAAHRCLLANRSRGIALCTGAALEFIVGEKRRAPRWIQRIGFEWAFRLASEPQRLWRRYLVDGPRIFAIWARWRN